MNEKQMKILGWVATFMSVMMYVSYFPQIMDNLAGHKGNFIQPLVAAINLSRAVKADEISVVEPTQPLRLARQSKEN